MERAVLVCHGELILPEHLPVRIRQGDPESKSAEATQESRLEDIEREAIMQALRENHYNRTETAKTLGISRRTLIYKLRRFRELGHTVDFLSDEPRVV